jgi:hypothetical protein
MLEFSYMWLLQNSSIYMYNTQHRTVSTLTSQCGQLREGP